MASGKLANCSTMAAEYEVSVKSIRRDIDYLRNQRGVPIGYDDTRRGYFYTEEQYSLPAIDLTESDLFAICIAEKVLTQHENSPVYNKLKTVFNKIEGSLPATVSVLPQWLDTSLSVVPEHQTVIDPSVWATITEGLNKRRALDIVYGRPGGENLSARRFNPYHLLRCMGEWYLVGHCHLRGALRTFAVSRIRSVKLLDDKFSLPEDFDPDVYRGGRFDVFGAGQRYQVRVLFDRDAGSYAVERQWHPDQEIIKQKDGGVELAFPAADLNGVKQWVLSWGGSAKVIGPEELVMQVRMELEKALAGYAGLGPTGD